MKVKTGFSKEEKVKACEKYHSGKYSYGSIAKEIGCSRESIRRWFFRYLQYGPSAFDITPDRKKYDNKFKLAMIDLYLSGNCSMAELTAKHKISVSMVQRWVQKYNNGINLEKEAGTMKSRKTTFEERLEIANWVLSNQMNYKEAAERYGVTYALVYKWTKSYLDGGEEALEYKKRGPKPPDPNKKHNLSEVEKLKQELEKEKALRKMRELEIEILKKKQDFEKKLRYQK
jgi:transposase-like protein